MKFSLNYEGAYDAFDGTMSGCTGGQCVKPCCGDKTLVTRDQQTKIYATTMMPDEKSFQDRTFGPLTDAGIETEEVNLSPDQETADIRVLIRRCLRPDGSCALKDRKPLQCRIFPLSLSNTTPLLPEKLCPNAKVIGSNSKVEEGLINIRRALGLKDQSQWKKNLLKQLIKIALK